jgi:hypothetical protein
VDDVRLHGRDVPVDLSERRRLEEAADAEPNGVDAEGSQASGSRAAVLLAEVCDGDIDTGDSCRTDEVGKEHLRASPAEPIDEHE